jgi:hypothetical protein
VPSDGLGELLVKQEDDTDQNIQQESNSFPRLPEGVRPPPEKARVESQHRRHNTPAQVRLWLGDTPGCARPARR